MRNSVLTLLFVFSRFTSRRRLRFDLRFLFSYFLMLFEQTAQCTVFSISLSSVRRRRRRFARFPAFVRARRTSKTRTRSNPPVLFLQSRRSASARLTTSCVVVVVVIVVSADGRSVLTLFRLFLVDVACAFPLPALSSLLPRPRQHRTVASASRGLGTVRGEAGASDASSFSFAVGSSSSYRY